MLDPEEVLATTLATEFAPATNLKNRVAGATWRDRVVAAMEAQGR